MTTSLVTGIGGFIGSHVADHLIRMGHEVIGLDDFSGGSRENVPHGALCRPGSIVDPGSVNALVALYKPDYIFHLAAYAAEGLSPFIRRFNYETNLIGSVNLINAAVNIGTVKRFVFTSSAAVYGHSIYSRPWSEDDAPTPIDPYAIAKLAVEMDLRAAQQMFGLEYTIFRPHNVFGPRQNLSDGYRNVVGIFVRQALSGQPLTIFGDGEQARQFTYIDDVSPYIAQSCEMPEAANQVFNIGSDQLVTVQGVAAWVASAVDPRRVTKVHVQERHEAARVYTDHTRFKACFGDHANMPPWTGIRYMTEWARAQPLREPRVFENIEIEKNLPESWRKLTHVD